MKTKVKILISLISIAGCISCTTMGAVTIPIEELKTKYANSESKFIKINGTDIHYRDEGSGPVLILLHGVCSSLHTWDGWVNELKSHFRIIRMDCPGFGLTGPPANGVYTPEAFVKALEDFVNAMRLKKFSLAGNSLGGYISWKYTLAHPERVDKLILVDPVGYKQDMPWILSFASNPLIRPVSRRMMPRFLIHMAAREVFGDKTKITRELQDRYFELAMREGNKNAWVEIFTVMKKRAQLESLSEGISSISRPALIIWGTKDEWIPIEHLESWKRDLPEAKIISYEGAGHTPMEEMPVETARDALKFLAGE